MLAFPFRIIFLIILLLSFISNSETSTQIKNDYLEGLFQEVDAREQNPKQLPPRLYDELIKGALSFKILDKYPNLRLGKLQFSPQYPQDLQGRGDDIKKGQELILNHIATPAMLRDPVRFKDLIDQINLKFQDSQSELHYTDWILIASAFRTLSAPDSTTKPNALGVFVAEYIIL